MISIIICVHNFERFERFRTGLLLNTSSKIELIDIDNTNNKYTIFQAYNIGVQKASNKILLFTHDDIFIKSYDWISKVENYFENDSKLGILGIAGTKTLLNAPGGWWAGGSIYKNIYQYSESRNSLVKETVGKGSLYSEDVVAIDGCWFCVRKSLFDKIKFDEDIFNGFHFYDLDLSMQVNLLGFRIAVVYDIDIEHYSLGSLNKDWYLSYIKFWYKWNKHLPYSIQNVKSNKVVELELFFDFLLHLRKLELFNGDSLKFIKLWVKSRTFFFGE